MAASVLMLGSTCNSNKDHKYEPQLAPIPVPGQTPEACKLAADRIEILKCMRSDGKPLWVSVKGKPWSVYCVEAANEGDVLRPDCIVRATDCEQVNVYSHVPLEKSCP